MKFMELIFVLAFGVCIGWFAAPSDPNKTATYGDTGLPKNCRALIAVSLESWYAKKYSADDIFSSIARNCGPNGYSWGK